MLISLGSAALKFNLRFTATLIHIHFLCILIVRVSMPSECYTKHDITQNVHRNRKN